MLVLSRKIHERIQIGDNITVTVVSINGNTIRLGIEAPIEVPISRRGPADHDEQVAEKQGD